MTPEMIATFDDYQGMTACPADFDEFWNARMAEADAVALSWDIMPADIPAFAGCAFFDLWFLGIKGERLHAKFLRPAVAPGTDVPLVLQFHGYPGASRSWFEQCSFVGMGMALIALDNPGQGGPSQDIGGYAGTTVAGHLVAGLDGPPENLYYVRLYQDLRILCRIVRELPGIDLSRVYVNGASQGGGMGIACAALNPELVARACILYPFLSDMRKVHELNLDVVAYEGIGYYSRWFDPDGSRADAWFGKLAYYETNQLARKVRCPVLFGTGLEDTVVPVATQCATYNALTCEKERYLYLGMGHEEIQDFDDLIIDYLGGRVGHYEELQLTSADGGKLRAMHVAPAPVSAVGVTPARRPVVLMFHDCTRPARGWHHITRYSALGYDVLQVENRANAAPEHLAASLPDALAGFDAAVALPGVDPDRVVAFGEGFGGALALAVAARRPVWRAVALNPWPAAALSEDARSIRCPTLLGTGLLDELSDPSDQLLVAQAIPQVTYKTYPKYAHERINAFENEVLCFIHD